MQDKIAKKISDELKLNVDQYEIISYGAFAVIQIIISIVAVAFFGLILGVMPQALMVSFSTSLLRQYSGGAHAGRPRSCIVIGTAASVGLALFIKLISSVLIFRHWISVVAMIFMVSFYIIYKKAPVDSEAKPIRTETKRKKMKMKSLIVVTTYFVLNIAFVIMYLSAYNINYIIYSLDICGGMLFQIFSLTIIGHKILGKIDDGVTFILFKKEGE
ncbi:MAG: accessory gene regulator ArgB-like protein [Eubacteriaceae bacterium]